MAESLVARPSSTSINVIPGRPTEQFEIQEPPDPPAAAIPTNATANNNDANDDDEAIVTYPAGAKPWLAVISLFFAATLHGLDLTIVAATIPSLTNDFHTLDDIGWYSSAYSLMAASFCFFFGRLYTVSSVPGRGTGPKRVYLASLCIFELGSLVCTIAPSSKVFILGRAVAGVGAQGIASGGFIIVARLFPKEKRPLFTTAVGAAQMLGIVSSPIVAGGLIDWLGTWRGCFGINLPLGHMAIVFVMLGFKGDVGGLRGARVDDDVVVVEESGSAISSDDAATQRRRRLCTAAKRYIRDFDVLGTLLMIPAITSFLLALQWGGNRYPWSDARIITLFILSAALLAGFAWRQNSLPESLATLTRRIVRMRSVLAGAWFTACANATLAVTEYYVTLYFQGVRGMSPTKSGVMMLPQLVGITVGGLLSGFGINRVGYYNPFMLATTILAPVAAGLLTTAGLDDPDAKVPALLGFLGVAVGLGIQTPIIALQTIMKPADLPMGIAFLGFGATMGNAVWIVVSAALFQGRLGAEIASRRADDAGNGLTGAGGLSTGNFTQVIATGEVGLSEIREFVGDERLRDVLLGYGDAVTQTMYLPLGLTVAMVVGAVFTEWQSVKKKQS